MVGLVLHHYDLDDRSYTARLALSMLGLAWTPVAVDVFPGRQHLASPHVELDPAGRLPVLEDDGLIVRGAEAVLAHLANAHDATGRWLPKDEAGFAEVMQWLVFSASELAAMSQARSRSIFGLEDEDPVLQESAARALRTMDDHMVMRGVLGQSWFTGAHPTIADIALFPAFALSRDIGIDHDEYPALRRWARHIRSLPGFITMPGIPAFH